MTLQYSLTNESLPAIMSGLDPNFKDDILAVGGSGDQAFSLLSSGARVCVIDKNPEQINYIKQRSTYANGGDFQLFLNPGEAGNCDNLHFFDNSDIIRSREAFFSKDIFSKICSNLGNLYFTWENDIFPFLLKNNNFNKIYLSNVPDFCGRGYVTSMENISSCLRPGTICYVSCGNKAQLKNHPPFLNLDIDTKKTKDARLLEPSWYPIVYRKP